MIAQIQQRRNDIALLDELIDRESAAYAAALKEVCDGLEVVPEYLTVAPYPKNPCNAVGKAVNGSEFRYFDAIVDGNNPVRPQLNALILESFGEGWTVPLEGWRTTAYEF